METKHTKGNFTPGPWVIHYGSAGPEIHPTDDKEGSFVIADVTTESVGNEQAEINAQLISALPELFEAAQAGAQSTHHPACSHGKQGDGNTCDCHVKLCQQAISKATNLPPKG